MGLVTRSPRYTFKEISLGRESNKNIKSSNDRPPLCLPTGKKVTVLVSSGILTLFNIVFSPPPRDGSLATVSLSEGYFIHKDQTNREPRGTKPQLRARSPTPRWLCGIRTQRCLSHPALREPEGRHRPPAPNALRPTHASRVRQLPPPQPPPPGSMT